MPSLRLFINTALTLGILATMAIASKAEDVCATARFICRWRWPWSFANAKPAILPRRTTVWFRCSPAWAYAAARFNPAAWASAAANSPTASHGNCPARAGARSG